MPRQPKIPAQLKNGPFRAGDALKAGLTREHLRSSGWRSLGCGFYVWAGLPDNPIFRLTAVRRRLPDSVFSGRTAAWLHGLDVPACEPVEVTVAEAPDKSLRSTVLLRRAKLEPHEVVMRRRMPATDIHRTLADLALRLPLVDAVVIADMALNRRLTHPDQLRDYAGDRAATRGARRLRRVVELADPGAESPMETRLRLVLVLAGLPPPAAQVPIHDAGGHFLGRPDLYYPAQRLGLEYDGGIHRESLVDDDRRQNRLLAAGVRLLRFTAADVHLAPAVVLAQVRAALASPASSTTQVSTLRSYVGERDNEMATVGGNGSRRSEPR